MFGNSYARWRPGEVIHSIRTPASFMCFILKGNVGLLSFTSRECRAPFIVLTSPNIDLMSN
jgi:hypothetical protein